jgi:ribosomal protein S11
MDFTRSNTKNNFNNFLESFSVKTKYIQTLKNKIEKITILKNQEFRYVNVRLLNKTFKHSKVEDSSNLPVEIKMDENNIVVYVLDITVTRSNSYLNIFDSAGRLKLSVSSGNLLDLSSKKRKTVKLFLLKALLKRIAKQKYLKGKPVAVHFKSKDSIPPTFLRKLTKKRLVKSITFFNKAPFNGCRKKKVRSV